MSKQAIISHDKGPNHVKKSETYKADGIFCTKKIICVLTISEDVHPLVPYAPTITKT